MTQSDTTLDIEALQKEGAEAFAAVKAHPTASLLLIRFLDVPGLVRRAAAGDETAAWCVLMIDNFMTKHGALPFKCCLCGDAMESPTHSGAIVVFSPEFKPGARAAIAVTCMPCAGGDLREVRNRVMEMVGVAPVFHAEGHA